MHYFITANHQGIEDVMLSGQLQPRVEAYLRSVVFPSMRPLSDEEYLNGPHAILSTAARFSYVLDNSDLFWCVEWNPGLLVICFSPNGSMKWTSVRSPNPEFGGRKAAAEEIEAFDHDAFNPQYDLIFDAWDDNSKSGRENVGNLLLTKFKNCITRRWQMSTNWGQDSNQAWPTMSEKSGDRNACRVLFGKVNVIYDQNTFPVRDTWDALPACDKPNKDNAPAAGA